MYAINIIRTIRVGGTAFNDSVGVVIDPSQTNILHEFKNVAKLVA